MHTLSLASSQAAGLGIAIESSRGFHSCIDESGRRGSVVPQLPTWSAFDVLTEGLELRLPDSRVFVEDHRAAQPLCGPAQPFCPQLLGVCLKGRKWKGTRILV